MDQHCLIVEYLNREDFLIGLEVLEKGRYTADEVSAVVRADDQALQDLKPTEQTSMREEKDGHSDPLAGEKTTAATTLLGGAVGGILGTMTMIGPLFLAGPIIGMAAGAVGGSALSAVEQWGISQQDAEGYEAKVSSGSTLIIVTGEELRVAEAKRMLKTTKYHSLESFEPSK